LRLQLPLLPHSLEYVQQECAQRKVFVLPAFETAPLENTAEAHALAATAAGHSKQELHKMVQQGKLWQFALKIFRKVSTTCSSGRVCHSELLQPGRIAAAAVGKLTACA
jgi:hypothetical protein